MKRYAFLFVLAIATVATLSAQVVTWSVRPGKYTSIEPCWTDIFYVHNNNNKIGVITGDGKEIVEPIADRISAFFHGLALVLQSDGGQERILGILSTDGSYVKVSGEYYAIPYQDFFSDGMLTVTDARGRAGYMNSNGVVVKMFDVSFVSPFSEGYAVVGEGEDYSLVDKRFNVLDILLGTMAGISGGSNVFDGEAIIWDNAGKFHSYNVMTGKSRKIKEPKTLEYDYMYCLSCITNRPESIIGVQPELKAETLTKVVKNNKIGYVVNNKLVLPYQFDEAESFHGNYAIVKQHGKCGVLCLHNVENSFDAKPESQISYKEGSGRGLKHRFALSVPDVWSESILNVKVKDYNGMECEPKHSGLVYDFEHDGAIGTKTFSVTVAGDGLTLWSGEISYNYSVEKPKPQYVERDNVEGNSGRLYKDLKVSIRMGETRANSSNQCYVYATITNPNSLPITTKVNWYGSSLLEGASTTVTVPANGSKEVTISLKVKRAIGNQSVTVTTNAGGSATLSGLDLIPFNIGL
ncbi:MAG: WG repeat-containing protein [Muribaculaceae bacterium]